MKVSSVVFAMRFFGLIHQKQQNSQAAAVFVENELNAESSKIPKFINRSHSKSSAWLANIFKDTEEEISTTIESSQSQIISKSPSPPFSALETLQTFDGLLREEKYDAAMEMMDDEFQFMTPQSKTPAGKVKWLQIRQNAKIHPNFSGVPQLTVADGSINENHPVVVERTATVKKGPLTFTLLQTIEFKNDNGKIIKMTIRKV